MLSVASMTTHASSTVLPIALSKLLVGELVQNLDVTHDYIEHQDVRITPSPMFFENAFEGKSYNQKLTIQNIGKNSAHIRICAPTSYAFKIQTLARGRNLCPGLIMTRNVKYTYMRATAVPFASVPIYINGELVNSKLVVLLSEVSICVIPQHIDFGTINAGYSTAIRMLSLHNSGSKGSRFAIDLGRNELGLLVEPAKGIIQPWSTVNFQIECLGKILGPFVKEFWIKSETPLRVKVTGTIISPGLHAYHPNVTEDFTLIDFPKTYYGTSYTKTMVIKNHSSLATMYCFLAEYPEECVDLEEARKCNPDYFSFSITPLEGTLHPQEARIFHFTYTPTESKKTKNEKFSFCCVQIVRVPCADLQQIAKAEIKELNASKQNQQAPSRRSSVEDNISSLSFPVSVDEELLLVERLPSIMETYTSQKEDLLLKKSVRVMLYGEAEVAGITIRPDCLGLLEIPPATTAARELLLVNNSNALPIIFNYKKVSCVEVQPARDVLVPSGRKEVIVTITPSKLGKVSTKIAFDLFFCNQPREDDDYLHIGYAEISLTFETPAKTKGVKPMINMGITPRYIKEVGIFTDDVRFNSPVEMPNSTLLKTIERNCNKADDDLVAFPNDRPKTTRPWKSSIRCRTICAGIARFINLDRDLKYQLTKSRSALKHTNETYYKKYLKQEAMRLETAKDLSKKSLSDYALSGTKNLLVKDFPKPECLPHKKDTSNKSPSTIIPLMPLQLHKIKVYPQDIKLSKMAPNTTTTTKVAILNQNDFAIRVSAKSRKPQIVLPEGECVMVKPHKKAEMAMIYNAPRLLGNYSVIVDFVINGSTTFMVSVSADVAPKWVKFQYDEVILAPEDDHGKYIDIYNPVNVPIKFQWTVPGTGFSLEPLNGLIPAYRHITCFLNYTPDHRSIPVGEVVLHSDNGRNQTVSVSAAIQQPNVKLKSAKVEFKEIPLNMPVHGNAVLCNLGKEPVSFSVTNPEPMLGVSIQPREGTIQGAGEQIFDINLEIPACITLRCVVEIIIQKVKPIKLEILGAVVYPNIVIQPTELQMQRLVPNGFDRNVFVVSNKSPVAATVEFLLSDYSEYMVLHDRHYGNDSVPVTFLELGPNDQRELYLHFNPIGAALYRFSLPILINGILGPVFLNNADSLNPQFYLQHTEEKYAQMSGRYVSVFKLPKALPVMAVHTSVLGDSLRFSKLQLHFKYYPHPHFHSETEIELRVWNGSKDTCKFCIRTDNMEPPFSIEYLTGNEITTLQYSIVCTLAPKEEVILKTSFTPCNPGVFFVQLPVYLRKYLDGNVFNYLTLQGWYPCPTIHPSQKTVYFEPVPLKCDTEHHIKLRLKYHPRPCTVSATTDSSELKVTIDKPMPSPGKFAQEAAVVLKYMASVPTFFTIQVRFFCDCGAECSATVLGCADNCTVTTHAFIKSYMKNLFVSQQDAHPAISEEEFNFAANRQRAAEYADSVTLSTCISMGNEIEMPTHFNDSLFPLFPDENDSSEHARHMRESVEALEEWLFHQGFYGNAYVTIPEGIAIIPEARKPPKEEDSGRKDKKKKKPAKVALKYLELLTNLIGNQVNKYLPISEMPEDHLQKVNFIHNFYSKCIELIVNQGGLLPHVFPEHLLVYTDYLTFMKNVRPFLTEFSDEQAPPLLNECKYYHRSKQSWFDVLLQTYKVFALSQVRAPVTYNLEFGQESLFLKQPEQTAQSESMSYNLFDATVNTENRESSITENGLTKEESKLFKEESCMSFKIAEDTEFWCYFYRREKQHTAIFSDPEIILLSWLEYNYNNQKEVLWGPENTCCNSSVPENRKVMFFARDLSDGLVLAAVTSAYCPYLRHFLHDTYSQPTCVEEAFHNVSNVLQCWQKLNLSFRLTPKMIIRPNNLQILMLVDYLYEVLPGFYPHNVMRFRAGLSTSCVKEIDVENLSSVPITYTVIFFGNEKGFFSVANPSIPLKPRGKTKLAVKYFARKVCLERVTMVLSGEVFGRPYAKAMAFTLMGEPVPSHCTSAISIPAPLYGIIELDIPIQSPYPGEAAYDLHFSLTEPTDVRTCRLLSWATLKHSKIPKRIVAPNSQLAVDVNGRGILNILVCCKTTNAKEVWVVCIHPEKGDFAFKLITEPEHTTEVDSTVFITLPENFDTLRCHCKSEAAGVSKLCPRVVPLRIPCRNNLLWNAVTGIMMKIVEECDIPFWQKYLGTTAGTQIKKWLTDQEKKNEAYYDIQEIFDSSVAYYISIESLIPGISLPFMTTIDNVHSEEEHVIPMHLENSVKTARDFKFRMESTTGLELRYYYVHFHKARKQSVYDNVVNVDLIDMQ